MPGAVRNAGMPRRSDGVICVHITGYPSQVSVLIMVQIASGSQACRSSLSLSTAQSLKRHICCRPQLQHRQAARRVQLSCQNHTYLPCLSAAHAASPQKRCIMTAHMFKSCSSCSAAVSTQRCLLRDCAHMANRPQLQCSRGSHSGGCACSSACVLPDQALDQRSIHLGYACSCRGPVRDGLVPDVNDDLAAYVVLLSILLRLPACQHARGNVEMINPLPHACTGAAMARCTGCGQFSGPSQHRPWLSRTAGTCQVEAHAGEGLCAAMQGFVCYDGLVARLIWSSLKIFSTMSLISAFLK